MAHVERLANVLKALRDLKTKYSEGRPPSVTVGYSQNYAVYVHEVPANHPVGQDKYLETPARRLANDGTLVGLVIEALKRGHKIAIGLLRAGMRIQREAHPLTPEDTGALRASAFTCYTQDVESVAAEAHAKGEAVRLAKQEGAEVMT